MLKKVVILGPESTGKSSLSIELAKYYHTAWCPEYAREYLLTNGLDYNFSDLLAIAKGQLSLEDEIADTMAATQNVEKKLFFIDTDMYVMKIWCEFVYGKCHSFILNEIVKRHYDLYLLCDIDLPWTFDDLREYPDLESRQRLFAMYKDCMINQPVPWVSLRGNYAERLQKAISAVDAME